jgi:hypothetical protein
MPVLLHQSDRRGDHGKVARTVKSKGTGMDWQILIPLQLYLPIV